MSCEIFSDVFLSSFGRRSNIVSIKDFSKYSRARNTDTEAGGAPIVPLKNTPKLYYDNTLQFCHYHAFSQPL